MYEFTYFISLADITRLVSYLIELRQKRNYNSCRKNKRTDQIWSQDNEWQAEGRLLHDSKTVHRWHDSYLHQLSNVQLPQHRVLLVCEQPGEVLPDQDEGNGALGQVVGNSDASCVLLVHKTNVMLPPPPGYKCLKHWYFLFCDNFLSRWLFIFSATSKKSNFILLWT